MKIKFIFLFLFIITIIVLFYISKSNHNIKIAVLDSGIDINHVDVSVKKRFDNKREVLDSLGHGSAITDIISKNNENIDFYDGNILDENGNTNIETLIKALDWCIENKVNLINMSFGLSENNIKLKKKIDEVDSHHILIVAAAGNKFGLKSDYPARYNNVISISAVDSKNKIYKLAAKGKIDFVSLGVDVETVKIKKLAEVKVLSGTSFATANATGYISKIIPDDFSLSYKDILHRLKQKTQVIKNVERDSTYGYGLLLNKN
ncbi:MULTISPECIES: S8 family serine peptidase [unclassified Bacillus (in: firmicutes)]|uniref:S8 family serine peptidase n=1 Tax=unclassified Bacillus (in: firmicutes) TaxID=185979 RepID=UPI000D02704F|nr:MULTISPECIES: S8 family serine peptidase [unclassified Bacillus (in: firmicutes)]PRR89396.1 peptidase S8 [Bacillus sp. NMCN1]PRR97127.1 peptidase S8 [Bacillus sp. NMCN6]